MSDPTEASALPAHSTVGKVHVVPVRCLAFCWAHQVEENRPKIQYDGPKRTVIRSVDEVLDMARDGKSMIQASAEMGISDTTLRKALEAVGRKEEFKALHLGTLSGPKTAGPAKPADDASVPEGTVELLSPQWPLLTMEGAKQVSAIVNGETEPIEGLWNREEGGLALCVSALEMHHGNDGITVGMMGIRVVGSDIGPGSVSRHYRRKDDVYGEAGILAVFLEDGSRVCVPVMTDRPIEFRRRLIV